VKYPPPAVQYPLQRSLRAGVFLLLLVAVVGCCALAWFFVPHGTVGAARRAVSVVLGLLWFASVLAAWSVWWRMPRGPLRWNGQTWSLPKMPMLQEPRVHWDVQTGLLLSLRSIGQHGTVWLWLEREHAPSYWHALRCAVYARHRSTAL